MIATPGRVYVLSTNRPGVVKVGKTGWSPSLRAAQLSETPGYCQFAPFTEAFSVATFDMDRAEAAAHRLLSHRRVRVAGHSCRELFYADVIEARQVVEAACRTVRPGGSRGIGFRWSWRNVLRFAGVATYLALSIWLLGIGR